MSSVSHGRYEAQRSDGNSASEQKAHGGHPFNVSSVTGYKSGPGRVAYAQLQFILNSRIPGTPTQAVAGEGHMMQTSPIIVPAREPV